MNIVAGERMSSLAVVGTQWGDEGKGKIIDLLSGEADIIARYQGGDNAGHTVRVGKEEFVFHLIPSGILHPGKICLLGNGVVIDLKALLGEMDYLKSKGVEFNDNFLIAENAHLTMPYHKILDKIIDERRGKGRLGTTGRGIGTAYIDKTARVGIRMIDLLDEDTFREKLEINLEEKNYLLEKFYNHKKVELESILEEYLSYGRRVKDYVSNISLFLEGALNEGRGVLFEGAQGTLLDIDFGTYPYVTSSNPIAGAVATGLGIGPTRIDKVMGVAKAYATRVGEGPFPTQFLLKFEEGMRIRGREYGATTGRPRRCGWFDAVVVRHAVRVNGLDSLAITKLDVLDKLEKIKICVGYKYKSEVLKEFPALLKVVRQCQPVYEEMEGWKEDTSQVRDYNKLPRRAKEYLRRIIELAKTDISLISVGPERKQTIILKNLMG